MDAERLKSEIGTAFYNSKRAFICVQRKLVPKPRDWKGKDWKDQNPGSYKWYEMQDAVDYQEEFEKSKIVFAEIATQGRFHFDDKN